MHDPGARSPANSGPGAAPPEQCMHQRPCVVPRRRVDDHPRGLVDDGDVFVLVDDVEGNRLGSGLDDVRLRNLEIDDVSGCHAVGGVRGVTVHHHQMALDQPRRGRPAQLGSVLGKEAIQPGRRGVRDQLVGFRMR